jgi:hypothetical protein
MDTAIYSRFAKLAFKKKFGTIKPNEAAELQRIIQSSPGKKELFDELMDDKKTAEKMKVFDSFDRAASWEKVRAEMSLPAPKPTILQKFISWLTKPKRV